MNLVELPQVTPETGHFKRARNEDKLTTASEMPDLSNEGWQQVDRGLFWTLGKTKIDPETGKESEDGDVVMAVEGELLEKDKANFQGDFVGRYYLRTERFGRVGILGSTILDDYFDSEDQPIEVGTTVRIICTGTARSKSGGRDVKQYEVFTR